MVRLSLLLAAAVVAVAGCANGPDAPAVAGTETICTETFCLAHPNDWVVEEVDDSYVVLAHPLDPDKIRATASGVNMEGLVTANGGSWPQNLSGVVDVFWSSLDGGNASVAEQRALEDGSVASYGSFRDGRLWYRIIALDTTDAIGVEVRGPNMSWQTHADIMLESLDPIAP